MKCVLLISILLVAPLVLQCVEAARGGCVCPAVYQPVCGPNRKLYSNQCQMTCALGKGARGSPAKNGRCK